MSAETKEDFIALWQFDVLSSHTPETLKLALQVQWKQWTSFRVVADKYIPKCRAVASENEATLWCKKFSSSPIEEMQPVKAVKRFFDVGWWHAGHSKPFMTLYVPPAIVQKWLDEVRSEMYLEWSGFVASRLPIVSVMMSACKHKYNFFAKDGPEWRIRGLTFLKAHGAVPCELTDVVAVVQKRDDCIGMCRFLQANRNGKPVVVEYSAESNEFWIFCFEANDWSPLIPRVAWEILPSGFDALEKLLRRDAVRAALKDIDWDHKSRSENESAVTRALELLDADVEDLPPHGNDA